MLMNKLFENVASSSGEQDAPAGAADTGAPYICFRTFFVIPGARRVMCDDGDVELGGRAFDLLVVLLRARGSVVPKHEIIQSVWPSTVVEECNLRFQMRLLRKALGKHRDAIKTIPGRGYMLTDDFSIRADRDAHEGNVPTDPEDGSTAEFGGDNSVGLPAAGATGPRPDRMQELERENRLLRRAIANLVSC